MKKRASIQHLQFSPEQRILVISDVHGNLPFLQGILKKVGFHRDDVLILLGDMIEKGKFSLDTLEYIWELEKNYQVYPLAGNYEELMSQFFGGSKQGFRFLSRFLKFNPNSLAFQATGEKKPKEISFSYLTNLQKKAQSRQEISSWLWRLPTMLETDDFLFVHGGVPSLEHLDTLYHWDCLKHDKFLKEDHIFSKYVVVGHTPTTLYHRGKQDASPILKRKEKIIAIDGGCVLKKDGQLNCLILQDGQISWDFYDGLQDVRVKKEQKASENPLNIRWGRSEVKVLDYQGEFASCLHIESGRTLKILTKFLHKQVKIGETTKCEDSTDYLLPVEQGEVISLSQQVEGGFLGKKDGVTGWYFGEYETLE